MWEFLKLAALVLVVNAISVGAAFTLAYQMGWFRQHGLLPKRMRDKK